MDTSGKHRFLIRWVTKNPRTIEKIRQRFNIPHYTTLNGFSPVEVTPADLLVIEETARRGFLSIDRSVTWSKQGNVFLFSKSNL